MADESSSTRVGLVRTDAVRAAGRPKVARAEEDDRRWVGGSDLLQDALDEVGRQDPELSNG